MSTEVFFFGDHGLYPFGELEGVGGWRGREGEKEKEREREKERKREKEREMWRVRGGARSRCLFSFFLFLNLSQTYRQTLDTFLKESTIKKKTGVQADARGVPKRVRSRDARNLHYPNPPGQSDLVL